MSQVPQQNQLKFSPRGVRVPEIDSNKRNRQYNHLKPAYEAMNWKNHIAHDQISRKSSVDGAYETLSARRAPVRHHYQRNTPLGAHVNSNAHSAANLLKQSGASSFHHQNEENARNSAVKYSRRTRNSIDHDQRAKQDTLRRVKMLQDKVLPLVSNGTGDELSGNKNDDYDFAWQSKMEQKMVKIENSVLNMRHQVEIQYEKRLLEMEARWENKFNELLHTHSLGPNGTDHYPKQPCNGYLDSQYSEHEGQNTEGDVPSDQQYRYDDQEVQQVPVQSANYYTSRFD